MIKAIIKYSLSKLGIGTFKIALAKKTQDNLKLKLIQDEIKCHQWLTEMKIKSIIDVGGNTGQFAKKMRSLFPDIMIYSFEPIPSVFEELKSNFKDDENFKAFNFGIGDAEGELSFNINEYSDSSSLLKMNPIHKLNFPYTINEKSTKIMVKRLDDIKELNKIEKPYLLKLDVQGYEDKVITGGIKITTEAHLIISEVSFYKLYEHQVLFHDIYSKLKELNFEYKGNFSQLHSPLNNTILQADAIFEKKIKCLFSQ